MHCNLLTHALHTLMVTYALLVQCLLASVAMLHYSAMHRAQRGA